MNTRYIIMADGHGKRWRGSEPKHLIKINGEVLLARTVRLLQGEDVVITSHDPRYNFAPRYEPKNNNCEIDRFLSNEEIWNKAGVTIFLYGDAYYSEKAISQIKNQRISDITFFGRRVGNSIKKYGEIFAVGVKNHQLFKETCEQVKEREKKGLSRGLGWSVYRTLVNKNFVELDSICEDFDKVEDLENFKRRYDFS